MSSLEDQIMCEKQKLACFEKWHKSRSVNWRTFFPFFWGEKGLNDFHSSSIGEKYTHVYHFGEIVRFLGGNNKK